MASHARRILLASGFLIAIASTGQAATIRVNVNGGADTAGCGSAASPCASIQFAVDQATAGDVLLVAQGTYVGNAGCDFGQFAVACIRKNLTLIGGFDGANWLVPSPETNTTVIDAQGTKRGVIVRGPSVTATVEGFTIRNGLTAGDDPQTGGGLVALVADVTLRDLVLEDNKAQGGANTQGSGGGVSIIGSSSDVSNATLERLTFKRNEARGGGGTNAQAGLGGGLVVVHAVAKGSQLEFESNKAFGGDLVGNPVPRPPNDGLGAGAAFTFGADVTIEGLIARNNSSTGGNGDTVAGWGVGGAIYAEGKTTAPDLVKVTITDADIRNNMIVGGVTPTGYGGAAGGGLFSTGSTLTLDRAAVIGNTAEGGGGGAGTAEGGGMAIWSPSTDNIIKNSIFAENEVKGALGSSGGGLRLLGTVATVSHSTFVGNFFSLAPTGKLGKAIALGPQPSGTLTLDYSIIANHANPSAADTVFIAGGTTGNFMQNLFKGNIQDTNQPGVGSGFNPGTFNFDPSNIRDSATATFFVNPGGSDYHVQSVMPPVDAATRSTSEPVDFDGAARVAPRDIGADEFGAVAHRLTIRKLGAGTGTVTSSPAGIACGADCTEVYAENQVVNLTASPDPGFAFGGFGGNADCADGSVTLDADKLCDAPFSDSPPAKIIVAKQTVPAGRAEVFQFSGALSGAIAHGQQLASGDLAPGTYVVTETDHPIFDLTSIACSDANSTGSLGSLTATFRLEAGETVTCTFTNALTTCSVGGPANRVLPNETVTGTRLEQACNSITAGPYTVAATGNVTFEALEAILRDGFTAGGLFTVINNIP